MFKKKVSPATGDSFEAETESSTPAIVSMLNDSLSSLFVAVDEQATKQVNKIKEQKWTTRIFTVDTSLS
jgi:hypothetical protein